MLYVETLLVHTFSFSAVRLLTSSGLRQAGVVSLAVILGQVSMHLLGGDTVVGMRKRGKSQCLSDSCGSLSL